MLLASHILANCLLGSIGRGPVTDIIFEGIPHRGPFPTVKAFHDWISSLLWRAFPNAQKKIDPWRPYLPDGEAITLSHGDLHRANIIISPTGPPRVIAIIDWAQAGWYPAYWEYCKACYTASYTEEWRNIWIPRFLDTWDDEFLFLSEDTHALGSL
jgi:thiamine kinase-like enzyme